MLRTNFIYPAKVDMSGNVVRPEGTLSLEEKEIILKFLESKHVPFNEFTLSEAFRLYVEGLLDIPSLEEDITR